MPKWVEKILQGHVGTHTCEGQCQLAKGLAIAVEALEKIKAICELSKKSTPLTFGDTMAANELAKEALRKIEELGK